MKTRSYLAIAALTAGALFTSCGKEDPTPSEPSNSEKISGTWYPKDISANGTVVIAGQTIPFVSTGSTIDPGSFFTFTHSNKTVVYDASAEVDISAGTTFTVPYDRSGQGTYEFKGNDSLIITEAGETTRYFILSWTDNRMILRSNQILSFAGQTANATIEAVIER